jgi:hypothetical protein
VFVPRGTNVDTSIGGRVYSGHTLDEMQSSGITPRVVEDAIANNKGVPVREPDSVVHDSGVNGVRVILNAKGKVITVTPIERKKN